MENGLLQMYNIPVSDNKKEWKYYLNLAGKKHYTNLDVKIIPLGYDNEVSLTKELLENEPTTLKELRKQDIYYKQLLEKYPTESLYIRGCIYPVDMDVAISAKSGTILNYDKRLIEPNEYTLISSLEQYIKNFLQRWHVNTFIITDELYLHGLLAILYANLPNQIVNLRNSKIGTMEAHSFHLEHFFNSNLDLWNNIKSLNKESIFWLYKNLLYVNKHIGKYGTFSKILKHVFDANGIGIGTYRLKVPLAEEFNNTDLSKPSYNKPNVVAVTEQLNNSYIIDDNRNNILDTIINKEIKKTGTEELDVYKESSEYLLNKELDYVNNEVDTAEQTKILDISTIKLFNPLGIDIYSLILDYWIYLVSIDKFGMVIDYRDANVTNDSLIKKDNTKPVAMRSNASQTYSVTHRVALLMALKILLKATNQLDRKIHSLTYTNVINNDKIVFDSNIKRLWHDHRHKSILETLKNRLPNINVVKYVYLDDYAEYLQSVLDYYKYNWYLDVNTEDKLLQANFKLFNTLQSQTGEYVLNPGGDDLTIDELLAKEGIDYILDDSFDLHTSFKGIMNAFAGMDISKLELVKKELVNYELLLDKLTSYTTQVITNVEEHETIYAQYNHNGVIYTKNPLYTILDGDLIPIEPDHVRINASANSMVDEALIVDIPHNVYIYSCEWPIKGHAILEMIRDHKDIVGDYTKYPYIVVDVVDDRNVDISTCEFEQGFLTIKKAEFYPLDSEPVRSDAYIMSKSLNNPMVSNIPIEPNVSIEEENIIVSGTMTISNKENKEANIIVEVE